MRYARENVAATVAASTILVFELWTKGTKKKKGVHYGSFLIPPSERQYYDILRPDIRPHFQLLDKQVDAYVDTLLCQDFDEVEYASRWSLKHPVRPKKFYTFLDSGRNHYLPEVTVVNGFAQGSAMREMADRIPVEDIATRMFVDDYDGVGSDVRGNLRRDIGFTAVNQTDPTVVPGMFFPRRLTPCSKMRGIEEGDSSLEESLFKYACEVMRMADEASYMNPQVGTAKTFFTEVRRDSKFGQEWCRELGLVGLEPWSRFDASSCFGTGVTIDHRVVKTENHTDSQNSKRHKQDHCPTYTQLVWIRTRTGSVIQVRIGINIYKKECCDKFMGRLAVNQDIEKMIREDMEARPDDDYTGQLHKRFIPKRENGEILEEWTHEADDDKDGYYSMYVNVLNEMGDKFGRNRGMLIEALLTIPLTPASDGWYHNFKELIKIFEQKQGRGRNLLEEYIELSKRMHGTVSWGKYQRCRVSHRGRMTKREIYHSAKNLDYILNFANMSDNTKYLVKKMSNSIKVGGIQGVGPFYAQVLINIATKIGLIENHDHIGRVTISASTATYKRLKKLGVTTPANARELVPYLCSKLGMTQHKCENLICELLRRKFGKSGTKDYFVRGHKLYVVDEGKIWTVNTRGTWTEVSYENAVYNDKYMPSTVWWQASIEFGKGGHEWDDTVFLLKKRKV